MMTLVLIVNCHVTNVKVVLLIVLHVLEFENSLSMMMRILLMNVFAHPTISKTQTLYFVMNVTPLVKNVHFHLLIVTHVLLKESQVLNQTAHAQVINT